MSSDSSQHPRLPQPPVVVGKGQLQIPYFMPWDGAAVAACGCKWKLRANHIDSCPVPFRLI